MLSVVLQCCWAAASLGFGLLALRVGRLPRDAFSTASRRLGWWVTGVGFSLLGASNVLFNAWAAYAFASGPGSPAWEGILRWARAGTYGRVGLVLAVAVLLTALALGVGEAERRFRAWAGATLAAALLAGTLAGAGRGMGGSVYFGALALLNAVEVVALLVALGTSLARRAQDRYLWLCLSFVVLSAVLNVGFFSALAWTAFAETGRALARVLHVYTLVSYLLMAALAAWRGARLRAGGTVRVTAEAPGERSLRQLA